MDGNRSFNALHLMTGEGDFLPASHPVLEGFQHQGERVLLQTQRQSQQENY